MHQSYMGITLSMNFRNGTKQSRAFVLNRLIGCDIYSFDFKLNHIAKHVQLPEAPKLGPAASALPPQESVPPFLVINVQLPTYPVRC
jgi:hypothetical protein